MTTPTGTTPLTMHVLGAEEEEEQREAFEVIHAGLAENGTRFEHVTYDARGVDINACQRDGIVAARYPQFDPDALARALAHRALWERCAAEDHPLLVCRNHALLRRDFPEACVTLLADAPREWDVLMLGYGFNTALDIELVPGVDVRGATHTDELRDEDVAAFLNDSRPSTLRPLNNAFGLTAYAVSPTGARQLLELCFPMAGLAVGVSALGTIINPAVNLDEIMNAYYRRLRAFAATPPLAFPLTCLPPERWPGRGASTGV